MYRVLLYLIICLISVNSFSQNDFTFRHLKLSKIEQLTINDGLSQGSVNSIIQDRKGFLWVTTKDGLNKYDGYKFTIYRNDIFDSTSISDNDLLRVKEDRTGRIWVLTRNRGLDIYNPLNETFIHINENMSNGISSNVINNFIFLPDNSVLALTKEGLNRIIVSDDYDINVKYLKSESDIMPFTDCLNIFIDSWGQIWFSDHLNIYKLNLDLTKNTFQLHLHPFDFKVPKPQYDYCVEPNHFIEDLNNECIYFRHTTCIVRLDLKSGKTSLIYDFMDFGAIYPNSLELDEYGNLWTTSINNFVKFDFKKNEITFYQSPEYKDIIYFSHSLFRDKTNNLWLTTTGYGLLKLNERKELFNHVTDNQLTIFSTKGLIPLPDGNIAVSSWIYTNLKIFEPEKMHIKGSYPIAGSGILKVLPDFNHHFTHFAVTPEGDKIFAKNETKVIRTNAAETKVITLYESREKTYYFPLFVSNNILWFANDGYLVRLQLSDNSYKKFKIPLQTRSHTNDQYEVNQILEDPNGNIWLATINGVILMNLNKGTWTIYPLLNETLKGLSAKTVFSMCFDPLEPKKYIWLGTNGGGLARLNYITRQILHFTTKDGLPNNVIYGILTDDQGHLWMSTNKGISKLDVKKLQFTNFEEKDGLQSNEFNRYAYCKLRDGRLVFGGVNGFNIFDPATIHLNTKSMPVSLTALYINNKPYKIGDLKRKKDNNLHIKLRHDQNVLRFEFASMDFTTPDKNLFRYKMENVDDDFSPPNPKHDATYTSLSPGTYTFTVMGTNADGIWSDQQLQVLIEILPPWWGTVWFRLLLVAITMAAIYGLYVFRLNQAKKIFMIRDSIASDLHDEIGSTLSNIALYGAVAKTTTAPENKQTIKMLEQINESTNNIMESMSDIIWAINTRNDNLDNIVHKIHSHAVQLMELKHCKVHFAHHGEFKGTHLNMAQRKNFYLFYKESINNISKYAGAENVWINIAIDKKSVRLLIKDDGVGMNVKVNEFKTQGGNGLYNLKKRADELKGKLTIDSDKGRGTVIELIFKK